MRNELNDIEKIERYLRNEMSGEEKSAFENEMQTNPALKKSVEEQRGLMKGMERMGMKKAAAKAGFRYRLQKIMVNVGIPVIITLGVTALILNYASDKKTKKEERNKEKVISEYSLPSQNENGDTLWADADKYIPYQTFTIDTKKDTVIEGKDGMVVAIPANAFVDENGNAVNGEITFELKEAFDTETILKGGLSTMSNDELLETGGMFYINVRQDGKSLKVAEGKNIYADLPSDPDKPGMMLFEGERMPDGSINWINPKPIEKPLVPVDIHSLNFYPLNYEDSLAAMGKDVANKKYKDSLYYSFAGRFGKDNLKVINYSGVTNNLYKEEAKDLIDTIRIDGEKLFNTNCASCHKPHLDYTGPSLRGARKRWKDAGYADAIYDFVQNPFKLIFEKKNPYAVEHYQKWKGAGIMTAQPFSKNELKAIFNYVDNYQSFDTSDSTSSFSGLNPAKVKAIWNDKFQNTLIATKEFEERMPFIHGLCSKGNNVLDLYVKNINKKICNIDSMVAKTLSGSDREQFLKFAARGEGRVKTNDRLLKQLGKYYDRQTEIYMNAAKKTRDAYYKKNQQQDKIAGEKMIEQNKKDVNRDANNFKKELMINLKDAYRQIGKEPNFVNGRIRLSVGTTGWKNLDAYVMEATVTRTTMNYIDPQTGKKAVLEYKPLNLKIQDIGDYDRILVYLIPDQLNSFMRMKRERDVFSEKLNMLFKHEVVILAYKGDDSYFKYLNSVNLDETYNISLTKQDESKIKTELYKMNKFIQSERVKNDITYQFFLQADQKRRKIFLEKEKFINRIEKVIFPCLNVRPMFSEDLQEF